MFTGSFEAGIYLLSAICAVPGHLHVLPVINTNFAHHIAAGLEDGTVIVGQNNISHPSLPTHAVPTPAAPHGDRAGVEDANGPGTLPTLSQPAMAFSKEHGEDLPSRIARLWYINPYGQRITIPANPRVLDALAGASCVIYSIGSLFTSIIPSLVLGGVGAAVANPAIRSKILILNGTLDRETGPSTNPFTALDFVAAIAGACAESRGLGVKVERQDYWSYVTHVIYLDSEHGPKVDREVLAGCGIECLRVYGRGGGRYDDVALRQALEAVVGRKGLGVTRRNTLVG